MSSMDRRTFLNNSGKVAVGAAAGAAVLTAASRSSAASSEVINLGFVGVGGRGGALLQGFAERSDCKVAAVCDVNSERLVRAKNFAEQQSGGKVQAYEDLRKMLEDKSLDAVVVATPDHWHSLAAAWACEAGKHVYVEKPVSNNVWEGRQAVKAARRNDRVVQAGMQNRSAPYNLKAREYIASGKLGDVTLCRVYNQKHHGAFRVGPPGDPPAGLNWDMWNGPATDTRFFRDKFDHWHEFWSYGGGDVTNCGVHQLDLACMLLGIETHPNSFYTAGEKRQDSDAETPDTVITTYQYDNLIMTFHQTLNTPYMFKTDGGIRNGDMFPYWPQNATRIEIFGTKGIMFMGRHGGGWQVFGKPHNRKPVVVEEMYGRFPDPEHKEEFVRAIKEKRRPSADIEYGHRSAALCHFANISFRVGNKYLEFNPATEQITNNDEANLLLRPEFRAPYVMPTTA
ncbi:MAG: Gfo/Idh/MocA family oxidoreductase [Pirellulales bacterium]